MRQIVDLTRWHITIDLVHQNQITLRASQDEASVVAHAQFGGQVSVHCVATFRGVGCLIHRVLQDIVEETAIVTPYRQSNTD